MATMPLVALDYKSPQFNDPMQQYGNLVQLAGALQQQKQQKQEAPLRQQMLEQQAQGGQLQLQQMQQAQKDQQTLRGLAPNFLTTNPDGTRGYNYDGLFNKAAELGVSPQTISALQKNINEGILSRAKVTKAQLDNETALNDQAFQRLEGMRQIQSPYQRQQLWNQNMQWVKKNYPDIKNNPDFLPLLAPDNDHLNMIEASLGMHGQMLKEALTQSQAAKNTAQANNYDATANTNTVKQYATVLSQATGQQDYTNKLGAFETLHPELAGRFPQQFDPKNPQAILKIGMSPESIAEMGQRSQLASFQQAQENYRAQLGRQTTFDNSRMLHGLNQIDDITANPQHGYGQFISQRNAVKSAIESAKNGNELAASLEPMMLALGVSSFAGVHRINETEINRAGPAAGSAFRKLDNLLNQVGTGKPSQAQLNEANSIVDQLSSARHAAYLQGVSAVAANTRLDPSSVMVFDQNGNLAPLNRLQSSGGRPATTPPTGAKYKVPGSDGRMHWSDGKHDLGVAQ